MAKDINTRSARTSIYALILLDDLVEKANEQRAKDHKAPITRSKAIEVASKRLRVKDLVEA